MAPGQTEVDKAHARLLTLKAIIRLERLRAEADPLNRRNVDLGLVEPDQTKPVAREQILDALNDMELFLDHLHVSHLAAAFETEAMSRLGNVIGEVRSAVKVSRKSGNNWPKNLVRSQTTFEGLHDIEQVLGLPAEIKNSFGVIRRCRNDFSHNARLTNNPKITSDDAREILAAMLQILR